MLGGYAVSVNEGQHERRISHFAVEGIFCAACVGRIERRLIAEEDVEAAVVNLATGGATVSHRGSPERLAQIVSEMGYPAKCVPSAAELHAKRAERERLRALDVQRRSGRAVAFALPLLFIGMGPMLWPSWHHWVHEHALVHHLSMLLLTLPILHAAAPELRLGARALAKGAPDMHSLTLLGASSALFYSLGVMAGLLTGGVHFESAGVIVALLLFGRRMEERARRENAAGLSSLLALQPRLATVRSDDGGTKRLPCELVPMGAHVLVAAGEVVPVDGVVNAGSSEVSEAFLSGESEQISKRAGDLVHAGSVNAGGALVIEATATGEHTALGEILRVVSEAAGSRAPIARLADRVVGVFVPVVLLLALITALVWLLSGQENAAAMALQHAVAVLVVACPCALGLATPASVSVGSARAAELGLLFRDAAALERLASSKTVVFDKTGTLTTGRPSLVRLERLGNLSEEEALRMAAALATHSRHPVSLAIAEAAAGLALPALEVNEVAGEGLFSEQDGTRWSLRRADNKMTSAEDAPFSQSVLWKDDIPQATFFTADTLRPAAGATLRRLRQMKLRIKILSGDRRAAVLHVAEGLGVAAEDALAERRPKDKLQQIREWQQAEPLAMVGDGVNDAPALAEAGVGLAMGGGTDVAAAAADVTLVRGNLSDVADAIELARAVLANIRLGLFWAFAYNVLLLPVAAGVFAAWDLHLSPMLAALAMSLSSLLVTLNARRLAKWRPRA